MKKFQSLLVAALMLLVFSCDNKKGSSGSNWTDEERRKFVETCVSSAPTLGDKAKPYCECSLEKLEKKYPNAADVNKLTNAETDEIARACLK